MSQITFELGRLTKQAAVAEHVLRGLGRLLDKAGPGIARTVGGAGRLFGHAAKKSPLATLLASIPAAGGISEGLSAAGQYTGLRTPTSDSLYAPHLSGVRFDPRISGWSSVLHAATKPFQFAKHLMGDKPHIPQGQELASGYNPTTGTVAGGTPTTTILPDGSVQHTTTYPQNSGLFELFERASAGVPGLPQRGKHYQAPVAPMLPEKPATQYRGYTPGHDLDPSKARTVSAPSPKFNDII